MKNLVLALLMVLSIFAIPVMADASDVEVASVELDGVDLSTATVSVERGETLDLDVLVTGLADSEDVQVKAWIGGYEHDVVQATSSMFDVESGVTYKVSLALDVPGDLEAGDYTLWVEVFDATSDSFSQFTLSVDEARHQVSIQDVLVEGADAGDSVSATVRLENTGANKEEDIKVMVSIPELGVQTSKYMSELASEAEVDADSEETSDQVTLSFRVPEDAATGDYTMNVVVSYNDGFSTAEGSATFHVDAAAQDSTVTVVLVDGAQDSGSDAVADAEATDSSEDSNDFSTALRLGFGILAVLVVVLALILIVRR